MTAALRTVENQGGKKRKVIGIDASTKPQKIFDQELRIAEFTYVKNGLEQGEIECKDVILDERYHDGTYGVPDRATIDALTFGTKTEAFITDLVYERDSPAWFDEHGQEG